MLSFPPFSEAVFILSLTIFLFFSYHFLVFVFVSSFQYLPSLSNVPNSTSTFSYFVLFRVPPLSLSLFLCSDSLSLTPSISSPPHFLTSSSIFVSCALSSLSPNFIFFRVTSLSLSPVPPTLPDFSFSPHVLTSSLPPALLSSYILSFLPFLSPYILSTSLIITLFSTLL